MKGGSLRSRGWNFQTAEFFGRVSTVGFIWLASQQPHLLEAAPKAHVSLFETKKVVWQSKPIVEQYKLPKKHALSYGEPFQLIFLFPNCINLFLSVGISVH